MNNDDRQDTERTFIELVDDILRSTPGLRFRRHVAAAGDRVDDDGPYATFVIETNPAYDLDVSLQLLDSAFRIVVNEKVFAHALESRRRIDRWIGSRCRDVEHMMRGSLKIETETILGRFLSSDLYAGSDRRWVEIGECDEGWGWIGLAAWLLPFGMSPLRTDTIEYVDWFDVSRHSALPAADVAVTAPEREVD